jgi:hypothetical protein
MAPLTQAGGVYGQRGGWHYHTRPGLRRLRIGGDVLYYVAPHCDA